MSMSATIGSMDDAPCGRIHAAESYYAITVYTSHVLVCRDLCTRVDLRVGKNNQTVHTRGLSHVDRPHITRPRQRIGARRSSELMATRNPPHPIHTSKKLLMSQKHCASCALPSANGSRNRIGTCQLRSAHDPIGSHIACSRQKRKLCVACHKGWGSMGLWGNDGPSSDARIKRGMCRGHTTLCKPCRSFGDSPSLTQTQQRMCPACGYAPSLCAARVRLP